MCLKIGEHLDIQISHKILCLERPYVVLVLKIIAEGSFEPILVDLHQEILKIKSISKRNSNWRG